MPQPSRSAATVGVRYLAVAVPIRLADGGSAVAILTLVLAQPGRSTALGGLLTALLTAPHLAGPLAAGPLARARDPRRLLAAAFAGFGVALTVSGLLLACGQLIVAAVTVTAAGCCGPFLTGGLSAQLRRAPGRRRMEAWDAATYGVGSTVGPALVAGLVALASPVAAVGTLGGSALIAAGLVLRLPASGERGSPASAPGLGAALATIRTVPPLRRTLLATTMAALGLGGLSVIAVVFGTGLSGHAAAGAALAASFGAGSVAGALVLVVRPLRAEPEAAAILLLALTGLPVAICAGAPDLAFAAVALFAAGAASAAQFAASLAVRATYASPETQTHVFMTMAGLKAGCASLGAALAGGLLALGPRVALLVAASLVVGAAAIAVTTRARDRAHAVPRLGERV